MSNVDLAFDKFRSRLETTDTENKAASSRQQKIRAQLDESELDIQDDFLTGSYRRETKTKPLRDVDIMIVLGDRNYLDKHPRKILDDVAGALTPHYGSARVTLDRRSVRVDFGITAVDDVADDVMSFDVVPAFTDNGSYLIPDDRLGTWIRTNPKVHADRATAANKGYSNNWKPLVKMIKKWNSHNENPVDPSFLVETMALDILRGEWFGPDAYELRMFFSTATDRISESWPDPAGVGPGIDDEMDQADKARAIVALLEAEKGCTRAIQLERGGNSGGAIAEWRTLFGPLFPAS
jgi:hypothetical protein